MDTTIATQFEGLQNLGSLTYLDSDLNTVSIFRLAWKRFVCWICCTSFEDTAEIEKYRAHTVAAAIRAFVRTHVEELFGDYNKPVEKAQKEKLLKAATNLDKLGQTLEKSALKSIAKGTLEHTKKLEKAIEDVACTALLIRMKIDQKNFSP